MENSTMADNPLIMPSSLIAYWQGVCLKYPPGVIELAVTFLAQLIGFWIPSTTYLAIDLCFPQFSNKHKIQSQRRQPSRSAIIHCVTEVLVANTISTIAQFGLAHYMDYQFTIFRVEGALPPFQEVLTQCAIALLAREVLFYSAHRCLHHPALYARIHKKHHHFTAPMAFSAQYGHPIEHLFANMMPIVLPMAIMRVHILTFAFFLITQLIETSSVHSGYDFASARMHDLHHEKFRMNFGAIGLMDWALGTNVEGWDKAGQAKKKL